MTRRINDAYYTPAWQVRALLHHQPIRGVIFEPCVGDHAIARLLETKLDVELVVTNDIDPTVYADHHIDASQPVLWEIVNKHTPIDWVITNPPYTMPTCTQIVEQAIKYARVGVAMLLRVSFREPTAKINPRGPFLKANPIDRALTLPRYSYTQNGNTDSATTEWLIWLKDKDLPKFALPPLLSLYNADVEFAEAL